MREQNENKVSGNMEFVVNEALREALLSINSVEDLKVLDNYNFSGSVDAYGTAFCVQHSFNQMCYSVNDDEEQTIEFLFLNLGFDDASTQITISDIVKVENEEMEGDHFVGLTFTCKDESVIFVEVSYLEMELEDDLEDDLEDEEIQ
nr:MAG TPA: hypothetical protein [Bacteriophage sp.]